MYDFPTPTGKELKQLYKTPYTFNQELLNLIESFYLHPRFRHRELFNQLKQPTDARDMAKLAYLKTKYFLDYPQQFMHSYDNLAADIITTMWKTFVHLHKYFREYEPEQYLRFNTKEMLKHSDRLLDTILNDTKTNNFYMTAKSKNRPDSRYKMLTENELLYYEDIDYG